MQNFTWKGGSGNLAVAANWLDQPHPADPVEPGVDDSVTIGGTGTLSGALDVLIAGMSGDLTLAGQITAVTSSFGNGTLTLSGTAAELSAGYVGVGGSTASTMLILAGAKVVQTDSTADVAVGGRPSESAILAVSGSGSQLTVAGDLTVGTEDGSTGDVSINEAGTVSATSVTLGDEAGSSGSISLAGAGSALSAETFGIGEAGSGSLSIASGATVSESDPYYGVWIATTAGVTGVVSVSGKGSALTDAGYFAVGDAGTGALAVDNGGTVSITAADGTNYQQGISVGARAGANGSITVRGVGSTIADVGYLTIGNLGTGSLAVSNGAAVTVGSWEFGIEVGQQAGASGSLTVSSGGKITATAAGVTVGNTAGATGSVTVTGVGSVINGTGYFGIGGPGEGSLTIAAGGRVSDSSLSVGVGDGAQAGGVGTILVTGAGSKLTAASYVEVGYAGTATLSIAAGGAVDSTAFVLAGGVAGSAGTITVDGAGSSLTTDAALQIGYGGAGSLTVTNGAKVDDDGSGADAFEVGSLAGSTGSVSVSGAGSALISATGFQVGLGGVGRLNVTAGATARAGEYLVFGSASGARGVGTITGATVTVGEAGVATDDVLIGDEGVGWLTLGVGGVLTDADSAGIGAGSLLTMAGGSFSATLLTNRGKITGFGALRGAVVNDSAITASGGTLLLNGAVTGTGSEQIVAAATLQLADASLGATGLIVGAAGSTLDGYGTVSSTIDMAGTVTSGAGITFSGSGDRFSGTLAGPAALTFKAGSDTFVGADITGAKVIVTGASLALSGTVTVSGNLTVDGAVTGSGTVTIGGGVSDFAGAFNQDVTFSGDVGTLELGHSQSYAGTVAGFSLTGGTALDLSDIAYVSGVTKASYSGDATSGVLTVTSGAEVARISLVGDYLSSTWTLGSDTHGGTTIVDPAKATSVAVTDAAASTPDLVSARGFIQAMAGFGAATSGPAAIAAEPWRAPALALASPVSRPA